MAAGIEIRNSGLGKLSQLVDPVDRAIARTLDEAGPFLDGKVQDAIRTKLDVRSGNLLRSVGHTRPDNRALEVGITRPADGKVLEYAQIQAEGGTVRARRARFRIQNVSGKPLVGPFLRIPVGDNLTDAGVDRGLKAFYLRTQAGNYIGVKADGSQAQLPDDIINVLKSEVTIRPHDYLVGPIEQNLPLIEGFLSKGLNDEFARLQ